jgi:ribosomal protein S18 acetylase RimI-like enzyme
LSSSSPTPPCLVCTEDPGSADAATLMAALSQTLATLTGSDGQASFDIEDVRGPRARFVVARDRVGRPVGCGALRPLEAADADIAEIKRMFAVPGSAGVGSAVLAFLEAEAQRLGYAQAWLETRLVNTRAVAFYERRGYARIENYGRYRGNAAAVCFAKRLAIPGEAA